jgi:GT2 family glycosyltransferase
MPKPLAIIPTYFTLPMDLEVYATCLSSLRETVGDACDCLVVDDGSPDRDLVTGASGIASRYGCEFVDKGPDRNEGYSRSVNVGLRKALLEERDAITVNMDIQFTTKTWLSLMLRQRETGGERPASMVGGLLLYPSGLIQFAGTGFSLLTRSFFHLYQYGPGNLPEAQVAKATPITGALQFLRWELLSTVGLYDETFRMGWEDVDMSIRTWQSGRECVYQPGIRAIHHESFVRGAHRKNPKIEAWTQESWMRFAAKHGDVSFAEFVPIMTVEGGLM